MDDPAQSPATTTTSPPKRPDRPIAGVLWMSCAGLLFVGVTGIVKHLDGSVPAAQAAFLRYLLGLPFLIPMWATIRSAKVTHRDWQLFGARGVVHSLGVILWFFAMSRITMAEVTSMNYLTPVYITLGAALFLGERLRIRRLLAVAAALIGALIILRPGVRELGAGHLAMLTTGFCLAGSYLLAKRLTDAASPALVVGMLSITVTIGLTPFAIAVWQPVTLDQVAWLFVVAALATGGHYAMTLAFRAAAMGVTQPVTFLQLVWAVVMGAILFEEEIDPWVIAGGLVIFASVSFIAWREARLKASSATAPAKV